MGGNCLAALIWVTQLENNLGIPAAILVQEYPLVDDLDEELSTQLAYLSA
jgi:hypothetical protein